MHLEVFRMNARLVPEVVTSDCLSRSRLIESSGGYICGTPAPEIRIFRKSSMDYADCFAEYFRKTVRDTAGLPEVRLSRSLEAFERFAYLHVLT